MSHIALRVGVLALLGSSACGNSSSLADAGVVDAIDAIVPAEPTACVSDSPETGFCDATELAGIDRADWTEPYEGPSGGVAIADFDNDGDLDLFFTGLHIDSALYINDGAGHFTDGTSAANLSGVTKASGVAAADLDNDGDQDLVVTGMASRVLLFENDGSGKFDEVGVAANLGQDLHNTSSVVVGDYDRDGLLDFYVTIWIEGTVGTRSTSHNLLYRNTGSLSFKEVSTTTGVGGMKAWFSLAAAFVDLDGDGWLDLYVANDFGMWEAANVDLRNQGDGTFAPALPASGGEVSVYGMSVCPGDYDNDGDLDLYVTNIGDNVLLQNTGGSLNDVAAAAGVTAYGYRADDEPYRDYLVIDPMSKDLEERQFAMWAERYLHPERERTHVATGWAALWLDYDQDGWLDLYVCNGSIQLPMIPEGLYQPNNLLRNLSDGTFADVTAAEGAGDRGTGRGCAMGDLDGDGDLDLVLANNSLDGIGRGRAVILRNDASNGHWLRVHLVGDTSVNRDGVGARVEVVTNGQTFLRVVSGGDGMLSSSQRDPHFGLGANETVDALIVAWPDGRVSVVIAPEVDTTVVVTPPS